MIKNLLITDIPKEEEALTKVLTIIQDYSWTKEAKEAFLHPDVKYIWYDSKYEQYVMGARLPRLDNVNIRPYVEVVKKC